jgi:hypothetical protein
LALSLDIGVEWFDNVPSMSPSRTAYIAHDDTHAPPRHECVETAIPDLPQFVQKLFAIVDMSELRAVSVAGILFQIPVRRRGNHQVDFGVLSKAAELAGISQNHLVMIFQDCRPLLPRASMRGTLLGERRLGWASFHRDSVQVQLLGHDSSSKADPIIQS